MSEVQAPNGIPQIPAGQQLGGHGTTANQGAAPSAPVVPVVTPTVAPEAPVNSPITGKPTAPLNPIQDQLKAPVHPQVTPENPEGTEEKPVTTVDVNPYKDKVVAKGDSYVHTSIKHLSTELGVSEDEFEAVYASALKHNDESLINPALLGKELTPEQTVRVQQLAQAAIQETTARVQHAQQSVYSIAGGEAQWNTAVQAFNTHAPQDEQGYASYLADLGKFEEAAKYVMAFNTRGGHTTTVTQAPEQGGNGTVQSGLSRAEYTAQVSALAKEAGNKSLTSPEFNPRLQALNAQRQVGRTQGR